MGRGDSQAKTTRKCSLFLMRWVSATYTHCHYAGDRYARWKAGFSKIPWVVVHLPCLSAQSFTQMDCPLTSHPGTCTRWAVMDIGGFTDNEKYLKQVLFEPGSKFLNTCYPFPPGSIFHFKTWPEQVTWKPCAPIFVSGATEYGNLRCPNLCKFWFPLGALFPMALTSS